MKEISSFHKSCYEIIAISDVYNKYAVWMPSIIQSTKPLNDGEHNSVVHETTTCNIIPVDD